MLPDNVVCFSGSADPADMLSRCDPACAGGRGCETARPGAGCQGDRAGSHGSVPDHGPHPPQPTGAGPGRHPHAHPGGAGRPL